MKQLGLKQLLATITYLPFFLSDSCTLIISKEWVSFYPQIYSYSD